MSGITPGFGGDETSRRIAKIERFLNQFKRTLAVIKTPGGKSVKCGILAETPIPGFLASSPLTLGRDDEGATIEFGKLLVSVTMIGVSVTTTSGGTTVRSMSYQGEIGGPEPYVPENLDTDRSKVTSLKWFGDVYMSWDASTEGVISNVRISGPEDPGDDPIPQTSGDFSRSKETGKYRVKIGSVPKTGTIEQDVAGHVSWNAVICVNAGSS